jgi:hypothetical protein
VGIGIASDVHKVVDLVHQTAVVELGEVRVLLGASELEEVPSQVQIVVVVGTEVAQDVPARAPNGTTELGVEGLGALRRDQLNHVAWLDPFPSTEREVDQQVGVALEMKRVDGGRGTVAARDSLRRHTAPDGIRPPGGLRSCRNL